MSTITGFSEQDLQRGGRLQRFNRASDSDFAALDRAAEQSGNPDETLTLYRQARAERVRLTRQYAERLEPWEAEHAADEELRSRAFEAIQAEPLRHLAMTIPFVWRGAGLLVPVLLIAFAHSLRTSHRNLALVTLMTLGYILFHGLFSHFEARYSAPLKPAMVALTVMMLTAVWNHLRALHLGRQVARSTST
jgi:hypothetical protein